MKTGYAQDCWGQTLKYIILDETLSGKYVVQHLIVLRDIKGQPFVASTSLQLIDKNSIHNIREEEI